MSTAISQALCEFLERAVHNILYHKGIYPNAMFHKRQAYGLSLYELMHPKYNEHISKTFKAVLFHLQNKTLERVLLTIMVNGVVIERYTVILYDINEELIADELDSLEDVFQQFCSIINSSVRNEPTLPHWSTFYINLGVTSNSAVLFNEEIGYTNAEWYVDEFDTETTKVIPLEVFETKKIKLHLILEKSDEDVFE